MQTEEQKTDFLDSKHKENLKHWIISLSIAKFDLDDGQIIESIYPTDVLNKNEQKMLSLLSFPDSNSFVGSEGNLRYIFRMKRDKMLNGKLLQLEYPFAYGFVYFLQRKDAKNSRGYFQKSVVILTNFPLLDFFLNLVQVIGNLYFNLENTDNFLEVACNNISTWPSPTRGKIMELPFVGQILPLTIPKYSKMVGGSNRQSTELERKDSFKRASSSNHRETEKEVKEEQKNEQKAEIPEIEEKIQNQNHEILLHKKHKDHNKEKSEGRKPGAQPANNLTFLLRHGDNKEKGAFQDVNLVRCFGGSKVGYFWKLWELVLTNQPILIVSDSPTKCSEAVLGVISLISPLEFSGDYRPYFTIYDPDYRLYQEEHEKKKIGNVILGVTNPLFLKTMKKFPFIFHLDNEFEEIEHMNNRTPINHLESNNTKIYIDQDKNVIKMLLPSDSEETAAINNSLLRKHFRKFTKSFLAIFENYFEKQTNEIKTFDEAAFIKSLSNTKFEFVGVFTKKSKIIKLYQKFIRSANFLNYIKTFRNVYIAKKSLMV